MEDRASTRRSKRDALTPSYCEIPTCEYRLFFQRHRIIPGRDGGKYKLGNVIALCPNHHAEADAELLEAEYLAEIVRKRIEDEQPNPEASSGASGDQSEGRSPSEEPGSRDGSCTPDAEDGGNLGIAPE